MSGVASSLIDKAVGMLERAWEHPGISSAERVLTQEGSTATKAFVNLVKETKMQGEQAKGLVHNAIKDDFTKIAEKGPAAAKEFNDFHKTGVVPKDVDTGLAAVKMKNIGLNLYNEAAATGIKTQPLITPNYFPSMPKEGMFDSEAKRMEMINHLIVTKQARNVAQASQILGFQSAKGEAPLRRIFHPFESPRKYQLDPKMYRDDLGTYYDYLTGAAERIGRARVAGPEGEKLEELLSVIHNTDGPASYAMARRVAAEELGYTFTARPDEAGFERAIKAGISATKLSLAPISNTLGGAANMMSVMGLKNFAEGAANFVANPKDWYEFSDQAGPSLYRGMQELRRTLGAENQSLIGKMSSKVLLNPAENMARNERMMRVLGSAVGKTGAENEFAKVLRNPNDTLARRRLTTLGIDVDAALRRGALDASDNAKAAYVFANKTMLKPDAFSLPEPWRNSAAGRILTMYKPFLFLQSKFVRDEIIMPALKRQDFRPLIWAAVTFPVIGEMAADIKMLARGRSTNDRPDFSKYPVDRIVDNISQIGGFGIAMDVTNALAVGSPVQTYSFLTGPVVSDAVDFASLFRIATSQAQEKARSKDRLSFFLRRVPVAGSIAAEKLAPPAKRVPGALQRGILSKATGLAK